MVSHISPEYPYSKFEFVPSDAYDLVLTGRDAVNHDILTRKLEMALGYFASEQVKLRLVFGVVGLIPIDQLKRLSWYDGLCQLIADFKQINRHISYHTEKI